MLKLKTLCQQFLEENYLLYEDSTRETTERTFRYLAQAIGNREIDRVTRSDIEYYRNWLVRTGRSKTTANIYVRALSPVFEWAKESKNLIPENPTRGVKQFRITRKPIFIYEDWQVQRMLRFASLRWQGIILTAWTTGLRRGAILNLTLNNIRSGYVYVEPKRNTAKTWWWEPKDKEIRKVPMTKDVKHIIDALDQFYPFLPSRTYERMLHLGSLGLLTGVQRRCPDWNFRRDYVKIQTRAFGRQIGDFHSLRKTFTTRMCEVLPDHFVMRLTGHNSLKTMTYYLASRESYFADARRIAQRGIKMGPLVCSSPQKKGSQSTAPIGRYQT